MLLVKHQFSWTLWVTANIRSQQNHIFTQLTKKPTQPTNIQVTLTDNYKARNPNLMSMIIQAPGMYSHVVPVVRMSPFLRPCASHLLHNKARLGKHLNIHIGKQCGH